MRRNRHWSAAEDRVLFEIASECGAASWGQVAKHFANRSANQCRERWVNHVNPDVVKRAFTSEEDSMLLELVSSLGTRWSVISLEFTGRPENAVKNRYFTLVRLGVAPKPNAWKFIAKMTTTTTTANTPSAARKGRRMKCASITACDGDNFSDEHQGVVARVGNHDSTIDSDKAYHHHDDHDDAHIPRLTQQQREFEVDVSSLVDSTSESDPHSLGDPAGSSLSIESGLSPFVHDPKFTDNHKKTQGDNPDAGLEYKTTETINPLQASVSPKYRDVAINDTAMMMTTRMTTATTPTIVLSSNAPTIRQYQFDPNSTLASNHQWRCPVLPSLDAILFTTPQLQPANHTATTDGLIGNRGNNHPQVSSDFLPLICDVGMMLMMPQSFRHVHRGSLPSLRCALATWGSASE